MRARLTAVVLGMLVVSGCGGSREPSPGTDAEVQALLDDLAQQVVTYEVEGTAGSVSITVETPTGSSQQQGVDVPLLPKSRPGRGLTFEFQSGDFVYLSAQNEGDSGEVACRITSDDTVISENTAYGAYAIATCDGNA